MISNEQMTELRLLELRSLVADKEAIVQNMTRENNMDGWLCDWNGALHQVDAEIKEKLRTIYGL